MWTHTWLYSVICLTLLGQHVVVVGCPTGCVCQAAQKSVNCERSGLERVPKGIPIGTIRLDLQGNRLTAIGPDDFVNLKNLKILQLTDNNITSIDEHAFETLRNLERLRLNHNLLQVIPEGLFKNNPKLHRLDLSENQLALITDDHLLGPKSMRNLQLDKNRLTCLDTQVINQWNELEILTLNGNSLNTLGQLDLNKELRVLRLFDNPWHCDCRMKWLRNLATTSELLQNVKCHRPAMLYGRTINNVDVQYMKCSGIEKRAATSCSETRVCPAVCTCTDTTVDCRDRGLKYIPMNLPSSTTELRLEQNHISSIPKDAFKALPNLRRLDLSKNNIHSIDPQAFVGLKSLNTLVLYANNVTDLPTDLFKPLGELQLLLLNANKLQCLRKDVFQGLDKLNLLSLYDNEIQSIANGTFGAMKSLQTLHLARNPLICDCNLEWMSRFLEHRPIETSGAKCEGPRRMAKKKLGTLKPDAFKCKGSESFVTKGAGECHIDHGCPSGCFCHHTTVDCSGRELTAIPTDLPMFATEIRLGRNLIKEVRASDRLGQLENLKRLDLSENRIELIGNGAFDGMRSLKELNLSSNHLRHFSTQYLGKTALFLEVLLLSDNRVMCAIPSSFVGLQRLRVLSLAKNNLRCVTEGSFDNMTAIKNLYLSENEFACNCHLRDLVSLLKNNSNVVFDSPVCSEPKPLVGRPLISLAQDELVCNDDTISVCAENGDYCPAGCACEESIVRCSGKNLKAFPVGIPADTTELYLDNNNIATLTENHLKRLVNLRKLDLSQNRLRIIESGLFNHQPHLNTLILAYNDLQCVEERAFHNLGSLKILSLHGNSISVLPESAFLHLRENLSHIAVGANELHCDCGLQWFATWLKQRFVEPGIAKCESPPSLRNKLLLTMEPARLECDGAQPLQVQAKCDACAKDKCMNGGTCIRKPGLGHECRCPAGFHGAHCEHEIDACFGNPCMNEGKCKVIEEGRFKCYCVKGFKGERCEQNIDDCVKNLCKNGGKCIDLANDYKCECPPMFSGKYCEKKLGYCSKDLNPCDNGGKCVKGSNGGYKCICQPGFSGLNCSTNVDDCAKDPCQNGGICVDGINAFTCNCPIGFSGANCEEPTSMANLMYNDNPPSCSPLTCQHGHCVPNEEDELECKCVHGFGGKDCDKLKVVGFTSDNAFVALPPWETRPVGNLSFTLRTEKSSGIIAYYGDEKAHLALELFEGRVKVSFYAGNYPSSHMYSYATVSDGVPRHLNVTVQANRVTLVIDQMAAQTVTNFGRIQEFDVPSKQFLYLGGLPQEKSLKAVSAFHIMSGESMKGCITDIVVNGEEMHLNDDIVEKKDTVAGCVGTVDVCAGVKCLNGGKCMENSTDADGFSCKCEDGFGGDRCEMRQIRCIKEKFREYVDDGQCRSMERVKNARCLGWCGSSGEDRSSADPSAACCRAVRVKKRKVRLQCLDGTERVKVVEIIRKCQCSNDCPAKSGLLL